jgi:hypothetical protein
MRRWACALPLLVLGAACQTVPVEEAKQVAPTFARTMPAFVRFFWAPFALVGDGGGGAR